MVMLMCSLMVKQTRYFVRCWSRRLSTDGAAVGFISFTGLLVIGRFTAVVIPVSAATTADQLSKAGSASMLASAELGGVTEGGIESARDANRRIDSMGILWLLQKHLTDVENM